MNRIRLSRPIASLPPEEAKLLADALFDLRRLAIDRARRREDHWIDLPLAGINQTISLRARPGAVGYRTEALLWGKNPVPTREDARRLGELLGLEHFVVDQLRVLWHVKEASYAGIKPSMAAATA